MSKALSCDDRFPEEIWCCLYEVWISNFRGNLSHIGPKPEDLYFFLLYNAKFWAKIAKTGIMRW